MPIDVPHLIAELIDQHHAPLRRDMERLEAALAGSPKQIRAPFAHFRRSMIEHMDHEESVVFPAMLAVCEGRLAPEKLPELHAEREAIGTFELSLREAARDAGPLEDEILRMLDELSEHIRKEDEELIPAVRARLRQAAPEAPRAAPRPPPPAEGRMWRLARRVWEKARRR